MFTCPNCEQEADYEDYRIEVGDGEVWVHGICNHCHTQFKSVYHHAEDTDVKKLGYGEPIPKYMEEHEIMPVAEFKQCCADRLFMDCDGEGQPAKDGFMMPYSISPSKLHEIPEDATHIVWYNK